jgi:ribosome-associated heat shock protein Hsp15
MASIDQTTCSGQRIDRWLWASRQYKTRSLAVDAIGNGRVEVNGVRTKAAKLVRPGDVVTVRRPPYSYELVVHELAEKRLSAPLAQALCSETERSVDARRELKLQVSSAAVVEDRQPGKLNKKQRRLREQMKRSFE